MKKRKITAIILASLMGISAVPATAWAADSYKETEKAAFAKAIQEMGADYAQDLAQIGDGAVKGNAEIKLSLDDGGKAILGMLTPVDISWLEDASMDTKVNLNEGTITFTANRIFLFSTLLARKSLQSFLWKTPWICTRLKAA